MSEKRPSVLVVDDNMVDRERVTRLVGDLYSLIEASNVEDALKVAESTSVGCVLLDYRLPDRNGDEAIEDFARLDIPVVMMTAQGDETVAVRVMKLGALDYLVKEKMEGRVLKRAIHLAFERHRLREQLTRTSIELEARDQRLGFVLRRLPVCAWDITDDGVLASLAGAGLAELWPGDPRELLGTPVAELESPLRELVTAPPGEETRDVLELPGGQVLRRFVDPAGPRGQVGMTIDVTETRAMESQLRHATKMEALGKLAGGVAHDFNNILTAITTFARFAREGVEPHQTEIAEDLDEVMGAAERATNLVKQLLAFSRRSPTTNRAADPGDAVAAALPMLRRLVGEDVVLTFTKPEKRWWVPLDTTRLESIVVNLVVNARDALEQGGSIDLELANRRLTQAITRGRGGRLEPGDYVVLSVADDGVGMAPTTVEHIFDPFFTTKDVGQGTGLGLSTVYGLIKEVGGTVTVYSELGQGTTFRVYLPRACRPSVEERDSARPAPRGEGWRAMLVEDDDAVRRALERMLADLGYTVIRGRGLDEVVARAREGGVDIVLSDVVMPSFDGFELAQRVAEVAPDLPVVLMSGYTDRTLRASRPAVDVPVLEKPVDPATLAHTLAAAIHARRDPLPDPG